MPDAVSDYKSGKKKAISAIIGRAMKLSKGKADALRLRKELEKQLK